MLFRRRNTSTSAWELRTKRYGGTQELHMSRAGVDVYVCGLFGSPVDADRNIATIERAMLLVDILNTRGLSVDELDKAVDQLRQNSPRKDNTP